jgi:hypothetical protein
VINAEMGLSPWNRVKYTNHGSDIAVPEVYMSDNAPSFPHHADVDSAKVPHAFQGGNFIDLSAEIVQLHTNHATGEQAGRKTKMLVKYLEFRIVLVAMQAGRKWEDHKTTARIMVQPLSGNQLASHI